MTELESNTTTAYLAFNTDAAGSPLVPLSGLDARLADSDTALLFETTVLSRLRREKMK